jgi:hypothetical protein
MRSLGMLRCREGMGRGEGDTKYDAYTLEFGACVGIFLLEDLEFIDRYGVCVRIQSEVQT